MGGGCRGRAPEGNFVLVFFFFIIFFVGLDLVLIK
jgi:hypothetical protein